MSPVPANIVVNFTANYNGAHRVCYRISGSSGAYTCVTTTCSIGPCSASIPIFVDNETCTTISYEGYVQASCQDISSSVDRIPFGLNFIPVPGCNLYTITCVNAPVALATITNPGTGYTLGANPPVIISGGGGTGATASSAVGTGAILTVGSIDPGSGYTNGTFTSVRVTGGTGSGAFATVNVSSGIVHTIAITTAGSGYQNSNLLGLNATDMGGASPSVVADFHVTTDYQTIKSITITNAGSGYTSVPTLSIATSGGTPAAGTISLQSCPSFNTDGCSGGIVTIPSGIMNVGGASISACNVGGPISVNSQYSISQNGNCLCNTVIATIGVTGAVSTQVRYFYNRKGAGVQTGLLTVGGSPSSIIDCIVPGSLVFQTLTVGTVGTVSLGGAC